MTPTELQQIRQIARQEAQSAVANAPSGYLPQIWTGEVQLYNACLAQQGVRTLRGLASIVCSLQSGGSGGVGPPCANERAFGFEAGRLTTIQHGTDLSTESPIVVRTTTLAYDANGRLETVTDNWDQEGTAYARTVTFTYDGTGQIATAVCSVPAPVPPLPLP